MEEACFFYYVKIVLELCRLCDKMIAGTEGNFV
jgi:hypothetical protein